MILPNNESTTLNVHHRTRMAVKIYAKGRGMTMVEATFRLLSIGLAYEMMANTPYKQRKIDAELGVPGAVRMIGNINDIIESLSEDEKAEILDVKTKEE